MHEYKLVEKINLEDIQSCLEEQSAQGWKLHSVLDDGKTQWIRMIWERKVQQTDTAKMKRKRTATV